MAPQNHITQYYLNQAGGSIGQYYAGAPFQKGHGVGSWLGGLFRTILPILKSGATAVGREAARAGSHVLADVAAGDNFKGSAKKHMEEAAANLINMAKRKAEDSMRGSGRIKRPRRGRGAHSTANTRRNNTSSEALDFLTLTKQHK